MPTNKHASRTVAAHHAWECLESSRTESSSIDLLSRPAGLADASYHIQLHIARELRKPTEIQRQEHRAAIVVRFMQSLLQTARWRIRPQQAMPDETTVISDGRVGGVEACAPGLLELPTFPSYLEKPCLVRCLPSYQSIHPPSCLEELCLLEQMDGNKHPTGEDYFRGRANHVPRRWIGLITPTSLRMAYLIVAVPR